jgi:hypothetical protein
VTKPIGLVVLSCAMVCAAATQAAAERPREIVLFDFETPGGALNLGPEFPGANGEFALSADAAHDGRLGGRLSFDLTQGNYVAWAYGLPKPLVEGARCVSVWVKTDVVGLRVHCKTRDGSGQELIRFVPGPPAGEWARLAFDLLTSDGHWGGANDGQVHWPVTLIQIGVEAGGEAKTGHLDMDSLTVTTVAPPREQPGAAIGVQSDRFGSLFEPGATAAFKVRVRGIERRPPQEFAVTYSVGDWQGRRLSQGSLGRLRIAQGQETERQLAISVPGFGAFSLDISLRNTADRSERVGARSWFGVLPGPAPPPCPWVGTGLHAGHGWAAGDLRFLEILTAAGIGVVREEFGWSGVETAKGQYATTPQIEAFVDGLVKRGIRLNLLLTYGNPIYDNPLDPDAYARWAGWMARHFEGRVRDFEIWNEPHNFQFMSYYGGQVAGDAPWIGKFVELTLNAGQAIRQVQPDANIIITAEDVWPALKQMLEEGIGPAGNVISIHPYCHGQPRPEREVFLRDGFRELRQVSREHGGPERVVITESGWTTYESNEDYLTVTAGYPRSSYVHQAQYIIRMFLTAQAAGADYAIQYDFMDDGDNRAYTEHNFGLVHQDYSPKPSFMAVAAMTRLLGQGRFVADVSPDPDAVRAYVFDVSGRPVVATYAIEGTATLELHVGAGQVEVADLMGNRRPLGAPGGVATIALSEAPVYVLGAERAALLASAQ